ncbi:HIT domain-containing protein [Candidatus Babeliales bacterium]|nr:HIT domain-containing protein [Candidatus Babeliales bacterium]MCF7899694.1 HIT domain-containing protein [Candidatus Babeliales bacterium]
MLDSKCIFCKIIKKEIPAKIIKENEHVMVIEDIHPKAPVHYLVLPKKHVININYLQESDFNLVTEMVKIVQEITKNIQDSTGKQVDFNLISNNGEGAGQSVFHMHWHFISGKNLYLDGFKL